MTQGKGIYATPESTILSNKFQKNMLYLA